MTKSNDAQTDSMNFITTLNAGDMISEQISMSNLLHDQVDLNQLDEEFVESVV